MNCLKKVRITIESIVRRSYVHQMPIDFMPLEADPQARAGDRSLHNHSISSRK